MNVPLNLWSAHALLAAVSTRSVAGNLAILAFSATVGLAIGAIRFRRVRLGISGVLFVSLLFGQIGFTIENDVLEFLRSFALVVFMYAIGLQVGPGFGASLRAEGIRLNLLAFGVLVLAGLMTAALVRVLPRETVPGLYAGAINTTPGLAAAQEVMHSNPLQSDGQTISARTGIAYSITYPFGVVGPMLVVIGLRRLYRVRMADERAALESTNDRADSRHSMMDIEVTNPARAGSRLADDPSLMNNGQIILTRLLRNEVMTVPTADTIIQAGDIFRAFGPEAKLLDLASSLGRRSKIDESKARGDVSRMNLVVTRSPVLHKSLRELNLIRRTGVTIARVNRAGVELSPDATLRLAFADQVTVVGPQAGLEAVAAELGNSHDLLTHSQLAPIFLGIVLGVLIGSIPIALPGMPGALCFGLAGGTMLAAIGLSRLGSIGPVVWYMPAAANLLFRDFGLAIFLACVGLQAGDHFVQRAAENSGLSLLAWGVAVTMLPVFLVACFARSVMRMNFVSLSGWVAGAMGSSPALLFAEEITESKSPAIAYAAVLPVAELLPIVCAQALAILAVRQ
jgi:putative transport protein